VSPDNQEQALAEFRRVGTYGPYGGLRIQGIADLSFLEEFPNLLYLEVLDQKKVNTRPLDGMENLRGLRINTPGAGLDFACFPHLEVFVGDWHQDNRNLHEAYELRQLRAWQFKTSSQDLSDLSGCTRLEWLQLVQTNVASLSGVESLEDLRYLEIAYAPKLTSLEAFRAGRSSVRELSFEKSKNITSYEPLAAIPKLRRLKLSSCAPAPNLRWIAGMKSLDFFTFAGTDIVDGDLSPLLKLPILRDVAAENRKHFNIKFESL